MIYPICIVSAAILVTLVLLIWVIPVFADVFQSFGPTCRADTVRHQPLELPHRELLVPLPHPPIQAFAVRRHVSHGVRAVPHRQILLKVPIFGPSCARPAIAASRARCRP
jgi:type IV pilus assembly protein PilC